MKDSCKTCKYYKLKDQICTRPELEQCDPFWDSYTDDPDTWGFQISLNVAKKFICNLFEQKESK